VFKQKVHGAIQMLNSQWLVQVEIDIIFGPVFHGQFGVRGQGSIGHHGEKGVLNGRGELAPGNGLVQVLADAQPVPELLEDEGSAHGLCIQEPHLLSVCHHGLCSQGVCVGEKSGHAFDKATNGVHVQPVFATETVEHLGADATTVGVAVVMCETKYTPLAAQKENKR